MNNDDQLNCEPIARRGMSYNLLLTLCDKLQRQNEKLKADIKYERHTWMRAQRELLQRIAELEELNKNNS